ncbi:MAG: YesL family protein [Clostridia bacterium]|nr:YesL family protein [Clostridia bacterium]
MNMLYLLFCIPIVTIGPATAGFTKILRNYAREEHAFLWADFIETFKKNFKQALGYGLLDLFVVAFLVLDLLAIQYVPNKIMVYLSLAAIFLSLTVWSFMRYYIYSMMITFRLTFKQLLKNAFIFCWAGFFRNLLLTVILAVVTFLGFQFLGLFMVFLLLTVYVSFCGLLVNFTVNPLIKKHMIDGFDPKTGERLEEEKYEGFEEEYEKDELDDPNEN